MLEFAQGVLQSQPFSRLLGAQVYACTRQMCEIRLVVRDDLKQQHGFVHGGVVSYLADNALTFAGGLALGQDVVTSEYKINYLRPARGVELLARASAIHAGKSQAVCRCEVFQVDAEGTESLCAIAQGTIAVLPTGAPLGAAAT